VAAELSRQGYVASLTLRNTRGIDILASNANATKSVGIQVKTNQGHNKEWMLTAKIEKETATNLFFVFVRLNNRDAPEYYIVPRVDVTRYVVENHQKWLRTPGRKGQQHKDNPVRQFADPENSYLNKSLMPLLPVRSTYCKGEAGAQRRCRGGIGMRHAECAGG
jgi:hypothetical protein